MSSLIPPDIASYWSRRDFIKFMGAATAMTALAGCRNRMPAEEILAYDHQPDGTILGEPRFFASCFPMSGFTHGILVECHEGRPTKIEGNPKHPASLGATNHFAQSAILDLYSPFRPRRPRLRNSKVDSEWSVVQSLLREQSRAAKSEARPAKIAVLTGDIVSPTLRHQLDELVRESKTAQWHSYSPTNRDQIYDGLKEELGQDGEPEFDFTNAERILSVDCDFLFTEPFAVAHARGFTQNRRRLRSRLYVAEPSCSVTGAKADQRWALPSSRLGPLLSEILDHLENPSAGGEYAALAQDLNQHRGRSLVLAGQAQDPEIHQLVHRINAALGNIGKTVRDRKPLHESFVGQCRSLRELTDQMRDGQIGTLIMIGGNPAFDAPADFKFTEALSQVPIKVHLAAEENETSFLCDWTLPESHFLECWSDAQSPDGTVSIIQPVIAPLHSSISAHSLVNWLSGNDDRTDYEIVRTYWKTRLGTSGFEAKWRQALIDGVIMTAGRESIASTRGRGGKSVVFTALPPGAIELELRPDPTIWDGTKRENPWLQELPKPTTQLTWDNALLVSPAFALGKSLQTGDVVRIEARGTNLEVAVFILQGLPENSLTLNFGYGSHLSGTVAGGAGFDAYPLRSSQQAWRATLTSIEKTGRSYELACTQAHHQFGERDLIKSVRSDELDDLKPPHIPLDKPLHKPLHKPLQTDFRDAHTDPSLDFGRGGLGAIVESVPHANLVDHEAQWAMSIDLDACIGCGTCVVACQAENNIPTVGKKMVLMGREMHWIRIDRYAPSADKNMTANETYVPQPVTCMHCEKAPCEVVCPVGATSHSSDGLNQMVYNRCVGTRYCSNNCPYKVRRFNFFKFANDSSELLKMARNPEVTVRSRGVMEKCTYCVQRIERVRIKAGREQRPIRDGEIITACQQSCPTQAIVFGNLKDASSEVAKARQGVRAYGLLTELGTRPRTTYLARITNVQAGGAT